MRQFSIVLLCAIMLSACKSKPVNRIIANKKEGKWIENYEQDSVIYKDVAYYKDDKPVKQWKTYVDDKIYKKEKYKNETCHVKYYHPNGKLQSKGKTRTETDSIETHWFYSGTWKFYSDNKEN